MNEAMRHAMHEALKQTYTREACQRHVDQLNERVALKPKAPPRLAGLLEKGIALNLRAIERCREVYPDAYEPHQILRKGDNAS